MTIARLHAIRRMLLGMQGLISAVVCEIEAELRAHGWRPAHGETRYDAGATTDRRVS